jgi:NAD(P)H dehydrogenase (quinone)
MIDNKKKILIINGHPDKDSYIFALAEAYKKGANLSGALVKEIIIRDLCFNPNLQYGYRKMTELEPDLIESQNNIKWAEHLVILFPVWWGSMPAIMKGFIDRVFLPGFAFKMRYNSVWWDKLLTNKSARIISTLDQPAWYYFFIYRQPSNNAMKKSLLKFIGINPVKVTTIGPIRLSKDTYRNNYLNKVERLGELNI